MIFSIISCGREPEPIFVLPPPPVVNPVIPPPSFSLPSVQECGYQAKPEDVEGWELIFEDNFDRDLSKWTSWKSGAFNNELQYYREENVAIDSQYLYIYGQRTDVIGRSTPIQEDMKSFDFASGRLESKREFGPGLTIGKTKIRFSARIRLVEGEGLWPAWWSYNDPWPTKGEIDILEARGNTPFEFQSNFHYGANVNQIQTNPEYNDFRYTHDRKLSECFHVYEMEWSKDYFNILFDGKVLHEYTSASYPFVNNFADKRHRLVLNLAIGGHFFTNLSVSRIPNNSFLVVDWVRVYEQ